MLLLLQLIAFVFGLVLVIATLISALRTLIVPRATDDLLLHAVFRAMWLVFRMFARSTYTYERRDRVMAFYAPLTLLMLPGIWITLVLIGYMFMYWGVGVQPMAQAFLLSGSSLLTLGFAPVDVVYLEIMVFSEAAIGLALVALLIAYLPAMYSAFSRREEAVNLLEVRAGSPPSATEWIRRSYRNRWLSEMGEHFAGWESWFASVEESHTSFLPLVFFRSPQPDRSWITASGAVLDTAALMDAVVDAEYEPMYGRLCMRAGYLALRRIADLFDIEYNPSPHFPDDSISISREEFDAACAEMVAAGVPLVADLDQAWHDFGGWRVNYDRVLVALAGLTMAPYAPWSSDRSLPDMHSLWADN